MLRRYKLLKKTHLSGQQTQNEIPTNLVMSNSYLRVVLVCNEYPPKPHGGIGTFVHSIAHGLANAGHDITVVGLGNTDEHLQDGNVHVICLASNKIRFVGNLFSRLRLRKWIITRFKAGLVDLVETPEYMGMLPFGAGNCPVVVRLHQADTSIKKAVGKPLNKGIAFYERRTLSANSNWIAVSDYILTITRTSFNVEPKKWKKIYNAVSQVGSDLPCINNAPQRYILYVSALSQRKGALVIAEAAKYIFEQQADLHLVYVGGVSKEDAEISAAILGKVGSSLTGRIHFIGHVARPEVLAWMKEAEVFVFPSSFESFGLVSLEAMQMGTPVVCTNIAAINEVVKDGYNGLLAESNVPSDWADKIKAVLNDPALANKLRTNGFRTVKEFSLEKCIKSTLEFYQEVLQ